MTERTSSEQSEFSDLTVSPRIKFVSLRNLLASVGRHLSKLLESRRIGIYLRGRESGNWALAVSRELDEVIEIGARVINQEQSSELKKCIETHQPCLLEEILPEDKAAVVRDENLIIAPMWCEDEVMGLLMAEFDAFASLSEKHMIQLNLAAQLIKTAIEKEFLQLQISKLEKDLAEIAMPDPERFMHNNRLIEWVVDREIERSQRHGASFAVLAIALDNLAHLMTQLKPALIEKVISEFSEVMGYIIRKCDLLTRRGGERFLCISMEQNQAGAMVLAEKLRHRVKETPVQVEGRTIQSTISVGIMVWPGEGRVTATELIQRAEAALKEAQSKGNRVRIWHPSLNQ